MKKTLVIGASNNPSRYSFKAINMLLKHKHEVEAISVKKGAVNSVIFQQGFPQLTDIHTVTLYVGPKIQPTYYDYIVKIKPKRIIFNPGTENEELYKIAHKNGIEVVVACTLVMLSTNQY